MNRIAIFAVLIALSTSRGWAADLFDRFPDSIHASERYVIYSHGFIVEGDDPRPVSPKYGRYDFPAIKEALFKDGGFNLIAYQRQKSSDDSYADTLKAWVHRLLDAGAKPSRITLVGFSRGAQLTALASNGLADVGINTALFAICENGEVSHAPGLNLGGNLSAHDYFSWLVA